MQGSSNMALAFLGPAQEIYRDKAARRNKQSATPLQEIGRGRFHTVYKIESGKLLDDSNFTGPWAYKVLANETFSDRETALICPQRSVRVMQEIDPEMPVGLYEGGWIMPFTPGESTLEEIALAEDDIFKNTRRVILDADKHNIVKGRLIDPDLALRPGSPASDQFYPGLASTCMYQKRVAQAQGAIWDEDQQLEDWLNDEPAFCG